MRLHSIPDNLPTGGEVQTFLALAMTETDRRVLPIATNVPVSLGNSFCPMRSAVQLAGVNWDSLTNQLKISMGRIRRLLQQQRVPAAPVDLRCPLCERLIPLSQRDAHHLVPKSKGGRHTEYLHRICHRQIHALFTETELARQLNSVEALLAHPDIASFVTWVKNKPDDFMERTSKSKRIRMR